VSTILSPISDVEQVTYALPVESSNNVVFIQIGHKVKLIETLMYP